MRPHDGRVASPMMAGEATSSRSLRAVHRNGRNANCTTSSSRQTSTPPPNPRVTFASSNLR
eukprot:scaffold12792_cov64-Phaeocystis_antarctica.AAC.6